MSFWLELVPTATQDLAVVNLTLNRVSSVFVMICYVVAVEHIYSFSNANPEIPY